MYFSKVWQNVIWALVCLFYLARTWLSNTSPPPPHPTSHIYVGEAFRIFWGTRLVHQTALFCTAFWDYKGICFQGTPLAFESLKNPFCASPLQSFSLRPSSRRLLCKCHRFKFKVPNHRSNVYVIPRFIECLTMCASFVALFFHGTRHASSPVVAPHWHRGIHVLSVVHCVVWGVRNG